MSNQQNDELYEIAFEALIKGHEVWTEIEFSAMCHLTGIDSRQVLEIIEQDMEPHQRSNYDELVNAAHEYSEGER